MEIGKSSWQDTSHLTFEKSLEIRKLDLQIQEAIEAGAINMEGLQGLVHDIHVMLQATRQMFSQMTKDDMPSFAAMESGQVGTIEINMMSEEVLDAIADWIEYAAKVAPPPDVLVGDLEKFLNIIAPASEEQLTIRETDLVQEIKG